MTYNKSVEPINYPAANLFLNSTVMLNVLERKLYKCVKIEKSQYIIIQSMFQK
jgi:hypothetical protein